MSYSLQEPASIAPPPPSEELQAVDYVPSEKDLLLVVWIGSQLECAAYRKGCIVSDILTHQDCTSCDAFGHRLGECIEKLGFKGIQAELLLDGGILDSASFTLPPIPNRQQATYIREKTRRLQTEKGVPLVWESQRIAGSKTGQKVLVHNIAKKAFSELTDHFARRGIALKKVLPFLGVAPRAFKEIPVPHEAATIVLTPAGSGFKILAIDHGGVLQFARDLNKENGKDPQRVAVEINRCLLFARQQFGRPIAQIVIVGIQAVRFQAGIKKVLQGEIPILRHTTNKALWLQQLARSNAFNLAKESMTQDRKLRWRKAITLSACLILGTALFGYAFRAEADRQSLLKDIAALEREEDNMRQRIALAETEEIEIQNHSAFLAATASAHRPPVEAALLNVLSRILPPDTWTTELEVVWLPEDKLWNVRIVLQCDADADGAERRKETIVAALGGAGIGLYIPPPEVDALQRVSISSGDFSQQTFAIDGYIQGEDTL